MLETNEVLGAGKSKRQKQVEDRIVHSAQDFFQKESSGASLITITRADVSPDMRHSTIYMSVLPENKEEAAINFAKRMRSDLRKKLMKDLGTKVIPFIEMSIDYGEKHRQRIDQLSKESRK